MTLGSQYAQGADSDTHIMLGPEKHARVRRGLRHVNHYITDNPRAIGNCREQSNAIANNFHVNINHLNKA